MTLDANQYANPETVLMRKQEAMEARHRHCGDCIHHKTLKLVDTEHVCDMGRHYGYQCTFYVKDSNGKNR
jgi:hypothetical protein